MAIHVQGSICPDAFLKITMGDKQAELAVEMQTILTKNMESIRRFSELTEKINGVKKQIESKELEVLQTKIPTSSFSSSRIYSVFSSGINYYLGSEIESKSPSSAELELESLQWELEEDKVELKHVKEDLFHQGSLMRRTQHKSDALAQISCIFGSNFEVLPYIKLKDMTPALSSAIQSAVFDHNKVVAGENTNGSIYIVFKKKVTEPKTGFYQQIIHELADKWFFIDETNCKSFLQTVPLFEDGELKNKEAFEKVKRIIASIYESQEGLI